MSVFIVVKAQADIYPDDQMRYQMGFLVEILGHDMLQGDTSGKYCQFEITDYDDYMALKTYLIQWYSQIEWEFVAHDYAIDGHRLRAWMTNMSASGLNPLTRDKIEAYLSRWNAVIYSTDTNEVVFDAKIFDAVKSEAFWDRDMALLGWTENSYNPTTGIHNIEVNYSNYPSLKSTAVVNEIEYRGGTIIKNIPNRITFDINRADVFDAFKRDVKLRMPKFSKRQFRVPDNFIQMALDAGGTLQITKNQFATYVRNRLDD